MGPHEGYLVVSGTATGQFRVPYWYAATEYIPAYIIVLSATTSARGSETRGDPVPRAGSFRRGDQDKLPEVPW